MITGAIRLAYYFNTEFMVDEPWHAPGLILWALVESGMYLIAATLPSLRPLVRFLYEKFEPRGYLRNLRDRFHRALLKRKCLEDSGSSGDVELRSTSATPISTSNGAPTAEFVKMEDVKPLGPAAAHKEWV